MLFLLVPLVNAQRETRGCQYDSDCPSGEVCKGGWCRDESIQPTSPEIEETKWVCYDVVHLTLLVGIFIGLVIGFILTGLYFRLIVTKKWKRRK